VGHLARGSASCLTRFGAPGSYLIRGFYGGDATHLASVGAAREAVRRSPTATTITKITPDPLKDGMTATITVKVTAPAGTPVPTGTVAVAPTNVVGSTAGYTCDATLVKGVGSCSVSPPVPSFGLVNFVAKYAGNGAHTRSASGGTVLPVQETTTTTVSPATAAAGSVTLSADVVSSGDADISNNNGGSGTVTFYIGNTVIPGCGAVLPTDPSKGKDNVATCTATFAHGSYTINAVYSGDDVNLTSTGTETLVVS
jgi:Bacterial Ig-like domain (group 3)